MANPNSPFGLRPVRYASSGKPYTGGFNTYLATGATGAIYIGDPVVMAGSANSTAVQGFEVGTLPTVTVAADGDGDPILGVCVGVMPVTDSSTVYRADSSDRIIYVADDPDLIYWCQIDTASTDWAVTDVGSYANLKAGTGSTFTGKSGWFGDTTDGPDAADPSNQLLIMRLANIPGNAAGEYAIWEVMINNHQLANVADGGRFTGV